MGQWYSVNRRHVDAYPDGTNREIVVVIVTPSDLARADKCVNACTGMSDPAGEIQRLRDALNVLRSKGQQYYNENAPGDTEFRAIMGFVYDTANTALSAKEAE
ncbi:MAG: hypothetical protein KGR25_00005 [Chloroflexi bacterium]|nr:hypothetical protein [Chloroflexota bacterium]